MKSGYLIKGALAMAAIAVITLFVALLLDDPKPKSLANGQGRILRSRRTIADKQPSRGERIDVARPVEQPLAVAVASKEGKKIRTSDDEIDEELLDRVTKELLVALEDAVRRGDRKAIIALADKLRALNYGMVAGGKSGGGLASVKRRILEALADVGAEGLGLVLDLLADADPVIAESATQILFKSLNTLKMSDYDRAEIVTAAAEELTDYNSLARLFNEFVKMRHSVGVGALKQIESSGTDEAKKHLPRVISAFTGDATITTVDQLNSWLDDYPDKPLDGWFFGREKLDIIKAGKSSE